MKMIFAPCCALLAALALLNGLRAEDRFEPTRELVRRYMTQEHMPSVAIAVAKDGKIIWEEGFGWADKEARVPATEHTIYSVASISKPFTPTALMTLVAAGKLELDRPANDYLGSAKLVAEVGDAQEATVRRLLTHTAGVSRYWNFYARDEKVPVPTIDDLIVRYGFIGAVPGQKVIYSNLGYGFLGRIIEGATGTTLADYAHERVFVPLGMDRTSFRPGPALQPYVAARYDKTGARLPDYVPDYPGAAGAYTTAHDLIRFAQFHLKNHLADQQPILTDAVIDEMQRPWAKNPLAGSDRGLGWVVDRNRLWVEHGGYMPGVSAKVRLVPSRNLAAVVLTNANTSDRQSAEVAILEAVLRAADPEGNPAAAAPAGPNNPPSSALPRTGPELSGIWKGRLHTYLADLPLEIELKADAEFARVRLGTQAPTALSNLRFTPATNGEPSLLEGDFHGDLGTPDANRMPRYLVRLELRLESGGLRGIARTVGLPGARWDSNLPHWVELTRQSQ